MHDFNGPVIRVSLRNLTERQLVFLDKTAEGMFSMTVLDPGGGRASIRKGREDLYRTAGEVQAEMNRKAGTKPGMIGALVLAGGSRAMRVILAPNPAAAGRQPPNTLPAASPLPIFPEYVFLGRNPDPVGEVTWLWPVWEDFDMSAPGTYRVSLGGRIEDLDTTVCSDTLEVKVYAVTNAPFDKVLSEARAFAFIKEAMIAALNDPRPWLRLAAAEKLASEAETDAIPALVEGLPPEWDRTKNLVLWDVATRQKLNLALMDLGSAWLLRDRQARGGQIRPTPSQQCAPPASPILSLALGQSPTAAGHEPVIHVSARNLTERPVAFFKEKSPADMFSVTVIDPRGGQARILRAKDYLYHPNPPATVASSRPSEAVLPPNAETSWDWRMGEDFDMSAPGVYRVSLGARLGYLNTAVCSNTLEVNVEK
jgi:hypothetical protein